LIGQGWVAAERDRRVQQREHQIRTNTRLAGCPGLAGVRRVRCALVIRAMGK
jgi:hypothetical protein